MWGDQQAALELSEHTVWLGKLHLSEPWKELRLLLNIALIAAFMVATFPVVCGLYENSQGFSSPSLGNVTGTDNNSNGLFPTIAAVAD